MLLSHSTVATSDCARPRNSIPIPSIPQILHPPISRGSRRNKRKNLQCWKQQTNTEPDFSYQTGSLLSLSRVLGSHCWAGRRGEPYPLDFIATPSKPTHTLDYICSSSSCCCCCCFCACCCCLHNHICSSHSTTGTVWIEEEEEAVWGSPSHTHHHHIEKEKGGRKPPPPTHTSNIQYATSYGEPTLHLAQRREKQQGGRGTA